MERRYGPDDVRRLVDRLRERVPGIYLRTSLIVGFPGETGKSFDRLLRFVHETRWDYLGVFPYSREEGTAAYSMPRQVSEDEKGKRAGRIRDLQADILSAGNAAMKGKEVEVLVEKTLSPMRAVGRHRGQAPEVDGNVILEKYAGKPGEFCRAKVTGSREWDLVAKPVDTGAATVILT
jgi:ribosomal protein S12 methylthiotransferase